MMPALITIRDFQNLYRVSRATVYRLKARGEITFLHIGRCVRISSSEAEAWARSLSGPASNDK